MSDEKPLEGRIALITGASRGIGAAVAKRLARAGAHVVATARTKAGLEELDDEIQAAGGAATLVPLDLTKHDQIDVLGASLYQRFQKLDILIGNAGILGSLSPMGHADPKEWDRIFSLNVGANQRLIRSLDGVLKQSDAGRAIFTTCTEASGDKPFWAGYGASKGALNTLVKTYARECEKTNMRVNLVDPGPVATTLRALAYPGEDASKISTPEEAAELFLKLSLPSCTINGEIVSTKNG